MLKLIKLELMKYKIGGNILGGFIAIAGILALLILGSTEGEFTSYEEVFIYANTFSSITFTIFGASLLAKFIVEEYKSKSITVLFMYPISRKKLMAAKGIIVLTFTFVFILITNVVSVYGFYLYDHFIQHVVQGELTTPMIKEHMLRTLATAVMSTFISLVPLYFGMRKKSVIVTIVSSIIIAGVLNSSNGTDFSLNSIVYIPLTISIIGLLIGYRVIRNVEKQDIT